MVWRAPEGGTADDMPGSTRPLPRRWRAGQPPRHPGPGRCLKRAASALAGLVALLAVAAGALLGRVPHPGPGPGRAQHAAPHRCSRRGRLLM